jgi:hypothetical protein
MPTPIPTQASLKVVKSFSYRGGTKRWSNRYFFKVDVPASGADWTALSDAVVTAEKAIYPNGIQIVETIGYLAGSEIPVFTKTYATNGTLAMGGTLLYAPGDVAVVGRYSTTARTSKNHPIYLFNYYHGAILDSNISSDTVPTSQANAVDTYLGQWTAGTWVTGKDYHRCGPFGASATGHQVLAHTRHRDFRN